ncbi:hypothetical protein G6F68_020056 [Rhizopus microsporus]|nr:hypothetical protein G6F68_020056 [Rhizopus microsporus]
MSAAWAATKSATPPASRATESIRTGAKSGGSVIAARARSAFARASCSLPALSARVLRAASKPALRSTMSPTDRIVSTANTSRNGAAASAIAFWKSVMTSYASA